MADNQSAVGKAINAVRDFRTNFRSNPYTEKADNYVKNEGDNSNNSNNGNNQNYNLDAIQAPGYNQQLQNSVYGDALKYSDQAASNANRQFANREWQSSQQAKSNYADKQNLDDGSYGRRKEIDKNTSPQSAGSLQSYNDGLTRYDPIVSGSPYSPTVTYTPREDKDVAVMKLQNTMKRSNDYADYVRSLSKGESDRRNNQMLNQQQNEANLRQTATQGQTQRDVAGIGAVGNILGSMFGSVGSGNPNYKFWN